MNWDLIGAMGEWAGAVAVVATLFYLAKQIRQQNKIAEYSAWKSMMSDFSEFNQLFVQDMSKLDVFTNGLADPEALTDEEAAHFQMIFRIQYNGVLNVWKAYETGNLPEKDWIGIASWFAYDSRTPGGRLWRSLNEPVFPEFWEAIDALPVHNKYGDVSLGRGAR